MQMIPKRIQGAEMEIGTYKIMTNDIKAPKALDV